MHWNPCFPKPQMNSLQWEQKVGCLKNLKTNLCSLTSKTFFFLMAPFRTRMLRGFSWVSIALPLDESAGESLPEELVQRSSEPKDLSFSSPIFDDDKWDKIHDKMLEMPLTVWVYFDCHRRLESRVSNGCFVTEESKVDNKLIEEEAKTCQSQETLIALFGCRWRWKSCALLRNWCNYDGSFLVIQLMKAQVTNTTRKEEGRMTCSRKNDSKTRQFRWCRGDDDKTRVKRDDWWL